MCTILHGKQSRADVEKPRWRGLIGWNHLLVEMLNGVSRLFLCELLSVLAGELLLDGCWAHVHGLLVFFGFGKGIGVVISLEVVCGVLCRLLRELLSVLA